MSKVVYEIGNFKYIPDDSGKYLQEFRNVPETRGGVATKHRIPNPFYSRNLIVEYLCFLFPSIIILIACLCYIYPQESFKSYYVLLFFYIVGILLSIIDLLTLCLPRCMETTTTISSKIKFFILGTITFTCSVLIIYFSKIQLDAEQDTTTTLTICVVFIVIFAKLTLYYIFKSKEPEDPTAKKIREKYGTISANRISELR
jgi:hypothetical protein